jgi:GTP-binding protein
MDIRHPMREFDQQMLNWCAVSGVPCHLLLTKSDKLKRGPAQAALLKVGKTLPPGATAQVFSSKNRTGLTELISRLNEWYEIAPRV